MQTLTLILILEYKSDGEITKADLARIEKQFQELIINCDRENIFTTNATYAGYNALLDRGEFKK